MKRYLVLVLALFACGMVHSQTRRSQSDFEKYRQVQDATFSRYLQQSQEDFKNYRDSLNREFASFLEEAWKRFNLQKKEPPIKNPIPALPVYDPAGPKPDPGKIPVIGEPEPPEPLPPVDTAPPSEPQPDAPPYPVKVSFFGTQIALKGFLQPVNPLPGVSEKEVAAYWKTLSKLPYDEWTGEIIRIKAELNLNDWGMYLLINKLFEVYFPRGTGNEQVVFSVFMLNQLGYRAKVGRNQNELIPLVAFQNEVYNALYFNYGNERDVKYWALNPQHKDMPSVQACQMDYPGATKNLDLRIETMPHWALSPRTKMLDDKKGSYEISYNKNSIDFYATYPCTEFPVYAEAAMDELAVNSIKAQVLPKIQGKPQEEAINLLLHFVQQAFEYMPDTERYGYERWFFGEETIVSAYSDCEDRSILFAQLVRRLLGMPVVLIHYPGIHLATAVKFDNPQTTGDYILVDGAKYLICDPTYKGANLGMGMPDLKKVAVVVIKLRAMNN